MGNFWWKLAAGSLCSLACALAQTNVLYQTDFEKSEGYDPASDLAGQRGWVSQGTGGNGLIEGLFPGLGQQAYVGFTPPSDTNSFTSVWRPVDFDPAVASYPLVRFSVKFQIVPSSSGSQDDFRWSVYNKAGDRLFSIDFESSTRLISYVLQDGKFLPTGSTIDFEGAYDLDIWMDFRRNAWSAFLNDSQIVNSAVLTQGNSALNFGDADAVWSLRSATTQDAGNNYMAFDNYRITTESVPAIPGYLEAQGVGADGLFKLRAFGQKGAKYALDVTADFIQWFELLTFTNKDGTFDFTDNTSKGYRASFYRLQPIP